MADNKDSLPTDIGRSGQTRVSDTGDKISLTALVGAGIDAMVSDVEPSMAGKRIGAYRVIRLIGRGGMGAVFLAERDDEQYKQSVAIKVVSDVALSPEVLGRFISERQILARLEHPYIAHLIDGGETDEGVPYLVMEYVEGEPIMDACRTQALSIDQRLDLFLKICEAIQFAHQNLIVHRDIKPGNILINRDGFPKVLDFGIAKILDPMQFDQTLIQTQDGQRLLTPEHAAPEQILGEPITTATDVYCLGILLYQLLTGSRPYSLAGARPGELEKIICEHPTPTPSARVSQLVKAQRLDLLPTTPDRLRKRLRGDIDNIILMALRKEPGRRYVSASALAEDIRRHRSGLPVSARPDTWTYRWGKFVKRHAFGVATGVTLFVLLSTFAINATLQSRRIERERQNAVQTNAYLIKFLKEVDPGMMRGEDIRVKTLLDKATENIDEDLAGQPGVRSTLKNTMGVIYRHYNFYAEADPLLDDALVLSEQLNDDPRTQVSYRNDLGENRVELARYDEAAELFRRALTDGREHFGNEHHEIARAMTGLGISLMELRDYDAAEPLLREALQIDRHLLDPDDPDLADTITGYATLLWRRNELDRARQYFEEALDLRRGSLGNDHFDTVEAVNNLAAVLIDAGDHAAAEPLFREALAMNERVLGPQAAVVAINLNNLGYVLLTRGRLEEAEPVYRRALLIERNELGAEHPDMSYSLNSLAETLTRTGQHGEAEALFLEALRVMARKGEFEHRLTGQVLANYAMLLMRLDRNEEAHERARLARPKIDGEYPPGHWRRAFAAGVLGETLLAIGRTEEARPLLEDSIEPIVQSMGAESVFANDARLRLMRLSAATAQ